MLNANKGKIFNQNDIVSSQDFKKTIVNIDSRFRDNYTTETTSHFTYKPIVPYKNIIKVALVSAEIPNVYYTFFFILKVCNYIYDYFKYVYLYIFFN